MPPRFSSRDVQAFFALVAAIVVPAALTLDRVVDAGRLIVESENPTPLGYTWSLGLFLIPLLVLAIWFWRRRDLPLQKRAFRITVAILASLGILLDLLFGHQFFTFPNEAATLGVTVPALGGPIPIEEIVFYITGFMVCLLLYIWGDEYWVAAYNIPDYEGEAQNTDRVVRFHPLSAAIGAGLIALAALYRFTVAGEAEGFPWYFTFLTAVSFVPSMGLYLAARRLINWRALSLAFFLMLLVSLLWEATLAIPYGWWGYEPEAMMGWNIDAWHGLPIEAVFVWLAVTFTSVIFYEVIKLCLAAQRSLWSILFGSSQRERTRRRSLRD